MPSRCASMALSACLTSSNASPIFWCVSAKSRCPSLPVVPTFVWRIARLLRKLSRASASRSPFNIASPICLKLVAKSRIHRELPGSSATSVSMIAMFFAIPTNLLLVPPRCVQSAGQIAVACRQMSARVQVLRTRVGQLFRNGERLSVGINRLLDSLAGSTAKSADPEEYSRRRDHVAARYLSARQAPVPLGY